MTRAILVLIAIAACRRETIEQRDAGAPPVARCSVHAGYYRKMPALDGCRVTDAKGIELERACARSSRIVVEVLPSGGVKLYRCHEVP